MQERLSFDPHFIACESKPTLTLATAVDLLWRQGGMTVCLSKAGCIMNSCFGPHGKPR